MHISSNRHYRMDVNPPDSSTAVSENRARSPQGMVTSAMTSMRLSQLNSLLKVNSCSVILILGQFALSSRHGLK